MKNRYAVLLTLLVVLLPPAALLAANYDVLFVKPEIQIVQRPAMKMLYIEHTGSYKKAPTFIVEIYQRMGGSGIECKELLGQYFHTGLVPEEQRYSRYGCVLTNSPDNLPDGFKEATIEASDYAFMTRYEQGPLVNFMYGLRLTQYAQSNGYVTTGYIIEMYSPERLKRGTAEMLQAVKKREF